jgi:hypothetical protein
LFKLTAETMHMWQSKWSEREMMTDLNRHIIGHLIVLLREREMPVRFKFIRGHHGSAAAYVSERH